MFIVKAHIIISLLYCTSYFLSSHPQQEWMSMSFGLLSVSWITTVRLSLALLTIERNLEPMILHYGLININRSIHNYVGQEVWFFASSSFPCRLLWWPLGNIFFLCSMAFLTSFSTFQKVYRFKEPFYVFFLFHLCIFILLLLICMIVSVNFLWKLMSVYLSVGWLVGLSTVCHNFLI